ncbi:hypothetical protein VKT23_014567 [Stygiomarasmius scandens]|uniref:Uncharacterized protein n=1 Tax=Marasmiellus scandens TaxID=2682957 RepID=A0ABR1J0J6_9AGAR
MSSRFSADSCEACSSSLLSKLSRAITHDSRSASPTKSSSPINDFSGWTFITSQDCESDTDSYSGSHSSSLPPYDETPEYSGKPEPVTLAMYLFRLGFLFPPLWILGAFILLSPLRSCNDSSLPASWLPEKTEAERREITHRFRKVELKWARRCLYAVLITVVAGTTIGVGIWALLKLTHSLEKLGLSA